MHSSLENVESQIRSRNRDRGFRVRHLAALDLAQLDERFRLAFTRYVSWDPRIPESQSERNELLLAGILKAHAPSLRATLETEIRGLDEKIADLEKEAADLRKKLEITDDSDLEEEVN